MENLQRIVSPDRTAFYYKNNYLLTVHVSFLLIALSMVIWGRHSQSPTVLRYSGSTNTLY